MTTPAERQLEKRAKDLCFAHWRAQGHSVSEADACASNYRLWSEFLPAAKAEADAAAPST